MSFREIVDICAALVSGTGMVVIVLGVPFAIPVARRMVKRCPELTFYVAYRRSLGRAILLGIELLVGADIIRTVGEMPTLRTVIALGLVVLIRSFLSITMAMELDGHWPWQRTETPAPGAPPARDTPRV